MLSGGSEGVRSKVEDYGLCLLGKLSGKEELG